MLKIENDFIYVNCTDNQAKVLDAVWVKSRKAYRLPNTLGALRELHRQGFDVAEYGKKKAEAAKMIIKWKEPPFIIPIPYEDRLRPYQLIDINYLKKLPHAAIFNEQRTGEQI